METTIIRQTASFKANPQDIYEALMDPKKHSELTGGNAVTSRKVGGHFTAYDGYVEGKNIELIPDKLIVQKWRGSDWPEGHFSTVIFLLEEVDENTRLTFIQVGVPEDQFADISEGLREFYWRPMKKLLEKRE